MKVAFESFGYKLAANFFEAKKPNGLAFLYIQGWAGHQNTRAAEMMAELGFSGMTYDMRGNGQSEGDFSKFSRADFINDSAVAYDFLATKLPSGALIGAAGGSFGSYTAVLLSLQRPLTCMSLRVPAGYPDEGYDQPQLDQKNMSEDFRAWRQKPLGSSENHAYRALHAFSGPVQIIKAENDEMVPSQTVDNFVNAVASKEQLDFHVMKGAPHRLETPELNDEYEQLLSAWALKIIHG